MKKLRLIGFLFCFCFAPAAQAQSTQPPPASPNVVDVSAAMKLAAIEQSEKEAAIARERQDLIAQQSMARSANSLLEPSWWQVWIGAFGLAGLLVSLTFNAWSLRQTRRALTSQSETAEAQMRAYLGVDSITVLYFTPGQRPMIKCTIKNYGSTPAYDVSENVAVKYVPIGAEPSTSTIAGEQGITINPSGISITSERLPTLTQETYERFSGEELATSEAFSYVSEISYRTFGETRQLRIAIIFWGPNAMHHQLISGHNWAD